MARKKVEEEENLLYAAEEPGEVEKALKGLPSENETISIFRMHDQGRPRFIDKMYPQEFDLKIIKARWGGGRYKVVAVTEDNQEITKVIEIEGKPLEEEFPVERAPRKGDWLKHGSTEAQENLPDPENFAELKTRFHSLELEIRSKNRDGELLKVLLPLIIGNREDPKKNLFEELNLLKGLLGSPQPVNVETGIIMDAIKMGREMNQSIEDGGGGNRIIEVIEKLLNHPFTVGIINAVKNSPAVQGARKPPDADMLAPKPPEQKTGFAAIAHMLQPYIPSFISSASAGSDPNILVDMTLPLIDKEKYPLIIEWLKSPAWFTDLMTLDLRIELQSAWWKNFADILLDALVNPETAEAEVAENPEVVK